MMCQGPIMEPVNVGRRVKGLGYSMAVFLPPQNLSKMLCCLSVPRLQAHGDPFFYSF